MSVIADLIRNPEGWQDGRHSHVRHRHSRVGGNLQGVVARQTVILALRQYPQGGADNNTNQHRHVIADLIRNPEGQGVRSNKKTTPTTNSPSPLMGEESKARVNTTTPTTLQLVLLF